MKLFIDSSTEYLCLGVLKEGSFITYSRHGKNDHSETLASCLNNFLSSNNILPTAIKEVYVGRGPGSYTGVRISGTVSKVLSYLLHCKLYSFSSLDLLLSSKLSSNALDKVYVPLIYAKKGHSYYKEVRVLNNNIIELIRDSFSNDEEINILNKEVIKINDSDALDLSTCFSNILKYHLYKSESFFDYTPNYLRSSFS